MRPKLLAPGGLRSPTGDNLPNVSAQRGGFRPGAQAPAASKFIGLGQCIASRNYLRRGEAILTIGWGIIGTGNYPNTSIAPAINQAKDAGLIAVYSRDQGRGEAFAQKHGAKTAYTSVEELLGD